MMTKPFFSLELTCIEGSPRIWIMDDDCVCAWYHVSKHSFDHGFSHLGQSSFTVDSMQPHSSVVGSTIDQRCTTQAYDCSNCLMRLCEGVPIAKRISAYARESSDLASLINLDCFLFFFFFFFLWPTRTQVKGSVVRPLCTGRKSAEVEKAKLLKAQ